MLADRKGRTCQIEYARLRDRGIMKITDELVRELAGSDEVYKMGQMLLNGYQDTRLFRNPEATLFFGYFDYDNGRKIYPSCYFLDQAHPAFHCSCDSLKYPCEHVISMLLSFLEGDDFYQGPAPLAAFSRFDAGPLNAFFRDVDHNRVTPLLEGLLAVESMVRWLLGKGLLAIDYDKFNELHHLAESSTGLGLKKLGQLLKRLASSLANESPRESFRLRITTDISACEICLDLIFQIQACIEHNRDFLQILYCGDTISEFTVSRFLNQPWIDWNTDLLQQCGLAIKDAKLIQLGFSTNLSGSMHESMSSPIGYWAAAGSPEIFLSSSDLAPAGYQNWASSRQESHGEVVLPEIAFMVPGDPNYGICWDEYRTRYVLPEDLISLRSHSHLQWEPVLSRVRECWTNPLADRFPVAMLQFENLVATDGQIFIESSHGEKLWLTEGTEASKGSSLHILKYLPFELRERQCLLVSFHHIRSKGQIGARPIALITEQEVIRLI